jgi:hypothetical protein
MSWPMSSFRRGDLVRVRRREEILATLDSDGCLDGMPFMPEMLRYCGRAFRVGMVAHKTCEVAQQTLTARKIAAAVHLDGLRCDGSAHGGCEAACSIYWKDAWLEPGSGLEPTVEDPSPDRGVAEDPGDPLAHTVFRRPDGPGEAVRYSCQATRLFDATEPLAWWDPRQYARDIISRNHSAGHVISVLLLAFLRECLQRSPRGYRILKALREAAHRRLLGRSAPDFVGAIPLDEPTPTGRLGLKPGDLVRVKPLEEIVKTINRKRKNRGMHFDKEMVPYCGQVGRVRGSVTRLIHEATGEMLEMKEPCIILEGFVCRADYSESRLLCPRATYPYWREIWLEPVGERSEEGHAARA